LVGGADDVCGEALDPEVSAPRLKDATSGELGKFHIDQFTTLDETFAFYDPFMRVTKLKFDITAHTRPYLSMAGPSLWPTIWYLDIP
jgi:hypothetical protein